MPQTNSLAWQRLHRNQKVEAHSSPVVQKDQGQQQRAENWLFQTWKESTHSGLLRTESHLALGPQNLKLKAAKGPPQRDSRFDLAQGAAETLDSTVVDRMEAPGQTMAHCYQAQNQTLQAPEQVWIQT